MQRSGVTLTYIIWLGSSSFTATCSRPTTSCSWSHIFKLGVVGNFTVAKAITSKFDFYKPNAFFKGNSSNKGREASSRDRVD